MAYDYPKKGEPPRRAKHSHYVSLSNNHVYPAMTNLPGYEDDNPNDWRAASAAERHRYIDGQHGPLNEPSADAVNLEVVTPVRGAPVSLKLAEDDAPATDAAATATAEPIAPPPAAIEPPPVAGAKAAF